MKVFVSFTRKADDNIARQRQTPARILDTLNTFEIVTSFVTTAHQFENAIAAGLHRQVDPITQVRILFDGCNDVRMKITRERGRKLDARQASRGNGAQQTAKRRGAGKAFKTVFDSRPVAVHILADEMNLFVAERLEPLRFRNDLARGPALFTSA